MTTKANSLCKVVVLVACAITLAVSATQVSAQGISQQIVDFSSYYNVNGINTDGTAPSNGGFDGGDYAYSQTAIQSSCVSAASPTTAYTCSGTYPALSFAESTTASVNFQFGPANAPDAVTGLGLGPVTLPSGQFTELQLLGAGVQGAQVGSVVVNYTDGSNLTLTQTFGDWFSSKCVGTGEQAALVPAYRLMPGGSTDNRPFYICLYNIALDPTKTVSTLVLPNNRNIIIMAASVVAIPGFSTSAGTPSATTVSPGSTITVPVTVTSEAGYSSSGNNSTVTLTYSVTPTIQTYQSATAPAVTFNPASVTVEPGVPATATMTFAPVAPKSAMADGHSGFFYAVWLPIPALALVGVGLGSGNSRRKKLLGMTLLLFLLAAVMITPACVSYTHLGNVGTPPGQYTISVTGTDSVTNTPQLGTGGTVTVTVQ